MEGRYAGNHVICKNSGKSLHYPDFDILLEGHSASVAGRRTKKHRSIRNIHRKCKKRLSGDVIFFQRKRLIQLLLIAVVLTFIFGSIGVHADPIDTSRNQEEFVYKVITVERGDTLWDIALIWYESTGDSIRTYINNVMKMNHLHGDRIQEGQLLLIYYKDVGDEVIASDGF